MARLRLLWLPLVAGCAARPVAPPAPPPLAVTADYRVGCPDALDVTFADRPEWDAVAAVDLDGRLNLPGRPRVDGLTADEARQAVARATGLDPDRVSVSVGEPRAARVYVTGPANRRTRVLPYPGSEPVIEFLNRAAALPHGEAELHDVYVVRSHAAAGRPAEVLPAGVTLEPADHVYVGETRRASFARLLPDWLKPFYQRLMRI